MTYQYQNIKSVELEISTFCNAACPQCPRNIQGGKTIHNLPLINWEFDQLRSILKIEFVRQLKMIYFCGTYGDPMTNPDIAKMCSWLKEINPNIRLGIHTNGGVGKNVSYKNLSSLVDFIAFGIDGLEDTNHLYRKNTNWNAIMKNVRTFIDHDGHAVWDFIIFRHNQHQVETARLLSRELGFQEFNVKKTGRFFNKAHKMVGKVDVLDLNGNKEYVLEPPTNTEYLNRAYQNLTQIDFDAYIKQTKITCYWRKNNMIYIGADGYVFPCGFLHDRLYGIEAEQTLDHKKILDWMEKIGGQHLANVFHTELSQIINGTWFQHIQNSWQSDRLERCAVLCGENVNLLSEQNVSIKYKNDLVKEQLKK
jgi:MoaA/NifB/PqqE/SkfB family radical SAM enzyme